MKKIIIFPKSKRYKQSTREYGFSRKQRVLSKEQKKIRKISKKPVLLYTVRDDFGRFKGTIRAK